MVRLHRPLALPLLCVLLHLFLFAVFHHFRSQYPLFRLLLQAHQFLHIQLVRLRGHHGGNGIRRNVLLPSHRLGTGSHRGFCLHHPPAVAHVLPFKPERRAPGKQMEGRRPYVCGRSRPYRLVLFRHPRTAGYNPIKVSQAYYCNDAFLNQLGINPVFNLMTSAIDDNRKENRLLHLMAEDEAIARVQTLLGRKGMDGISPIAHRVEADSLPTRRNVVVILMESMSAHLMQTFGHETSLTPFLDSLWQQSLSFSHFYSSGIHTNHGMYSSLYSFPAMMKRNAMKGSVIPVYSGLPTVLKENGYHNMFFMTHESQYDNMNAFFRTNGFDDIYSQENYPADKVVNGFGVQDDFLFQYALPVLDRQAQSGQPFFSVLLTISNHPPYIIPPYFHPRSRTTEEQIVEYADWSIRNFMTEALKRPWADNTLFVLLGDHGKLVGTPECESPQSYNHIPLMIYGRDIAPRIVDAYGGQVDLAPTLLGLLGIGYVQNDFGVDLLKEKRPYMYFTADNLIGVRDSSRLFLYFPDTQQEIRYRTEGMTVQTAEDDPVFRDMKQYGFAMLQCAEVLVQRQQTLNHPHGDKR